jgi:hypothetical protein
VGNHRTQGEEPAVCPKTKIIKTGGRIHMGSSFMRVDDVAAELGVSKSNAYKIVRKLNAELKNMGYLIVAGRVSKKYFMEKVCYNGNENKERK